MIRVDTSARISLSALRKEKPAGALVREIVRNQDVLLVRLVLDGAPYVCLMYFTAPEFESSAPPKLTARFVRARDAFRESLHLLIKKPLAMRAGEPGQSVQAVLQQRTP